VEYSQCYGDENILHNLDEIHARLTRNGMDSQRAAKWIDAILELFEQSMGTPFIPCKGNEAARLFVGLADKDLDEYVARRRK
jgi:hypothetical protein